MFNKLFNELVKQNNLNKNSGFKDIAQAAINAYYLVPYPGDRDKKPAKANRHHHGGTHVSSTAINIDLLIALYKKYDPTNQAAHLTDPEIKLLKLAAIYHDAANTSETEGKEEAHAQIFENDMKLLGFTSEEIKPFALAIAQKESQKPREIKQQATNVYQLLLEDADKLDVIRVKKDDFNMQRLAIVQAMKDKPDFIKEMEQLVVNHKITLKTIYEDNSLHVQCEYAANCYDAVYAAEKEMLLNYIVLECMKQGKLISFSQIDLSGISILDLFNRENSQFVKNRISALIQQDIESKPISEEKTLSLGCMKKVGALYAPCKGI